MTEFALVSPVLLLLTFGIIDFGRAMYFYALLANSARIGGRAVAVESYPLPTNASVLSLVQVVTPGLTVAAPECPDGPLSGTPPPDTAWLYVTETPAPSAVEASPPANAPGGEPSAAAGSCSAVNPASGGSSLTVTLVYNFTPATPVIRDVIAGHITLTGSAVVRTEY